MIEHLKTVAAWVHNAGLKISYKGPGDNSLSVMISGWVLLLLLGLWIYSWVRA